jgi:hypothetical protein
MLFEPTISASRWAPEHQAWSFGLSPGNFYAYRLVRPTAVQGLRKVKNFQIHLLLTCDDTRIEHACTWFLFVQKELNPGEAVCRPLIPQVNGGMDPVLDHPDCLIDAGMISNYQTGKPHYCPLSRLLESGDSLCFGVQNISSDDDQIGIWASIGFCTCYA